jgi:hypothetical protein
MMVTIHKDGDFCSIAGRDEQLLADAAASLCRFYGWCQQAGWVIVAQKNWLSMTWLQPCFVRFKNKGNSWKLWRF